MLILRVSHAAGSFRRGIKWEWRPELEAKRLVQDLVKRHLMHNHYHAWNEVHGYI